MQQIFLKTFYVYLMNASFCLAFELAVSELYDRSITLLIYKFENWESATLKFYFLIWTRIELMLILRNVY